MLKPVFSLISQRTLNKALVSDGHDLMEDVADVLLPAVAVCPVVSVGRRQGHAPLHRVPGQVDAGQSLQHPGLIVHGSRGPGRGGGAAPGPLGARAPPRRRKRGKSQTKQQQQEEKNQYLCFDRISAVYSTLLSFPVP